MPLLLRIFLGNLVADLVNCNLGVEGTKQLTKANWLNARNVIHM